MNDYDYLNARIRGMAASLFSRETYEQILAGAADSQLVDTLLASGYEKELQAALGGAAFDRPTGAGPRQPIEARDGPSERAAQLRAIEAALAANLRATFARIREI